jgi:hypothetical protein
LAWLFSRCWCAKPLIGRNWIGKSALIPDIRVDQGGMRFTWPRLFFLAAIASAQDEVTPPPPILFTGVADGFYSANLNRPASGVNLFHNFDQNDGFQLNSAQISLEHDGESWGFELDGGTGEMFRIMNAPDPWHGPNRYISQALITYKHSRVTFDFGKFYSNIGAESPESYKNFNYTRSLLYVLGEPYDHFGARASLRVTKSFSAGVQQVNGWNNVRPNDLKTTGLTSNWTGEKWGWSQIYMMGPQQPPSSQGWRRVYNSVLTASPSPRVTAYLELLYGWEQAAGRWNGFAAASKFSISKKWSASSRLERFNDEFGTLTGAPRLILEGTATLEYKPSVHCIVRAELRRDWANVGTFETGSFPALSKTQDTFLLGVIGVFKNSH